MPSGQCRWDPVHICRVLILDEYPKETSGVHIFHHSPDEHRLTLAELELQHTPGEEVFVRPTPLPSGLRQDTTPGVVHLAIGEGKIAVDVCKFVVGDVGY